MSNTAATSGKSGAVFALFSNTNTAIKAAGLNNGDESLRKRGIESRPSG
ncbi:MAG: hypothetical protein LBB48_01605 [Treponema sp.]|nr:hypothetical protein [Treponema sp.]